MHRFFAIFTSACILLTTLVGCSTQTTTQTDTTSEETQSYHVVATNFAAYDWTTALLSGTDGVTVTYLLDSGVDSHSYQPTADDIIEIVQCDLFIYVGGESDTWVDAVLAQATNPDMLVLNLMESLGDGVLAEEAVEGMEAHDHESEDDHDHEEEDDHDHEEDDDHDHESEDDHDHEEEDDHDHEEETVADEHIWLSLTNAQVLTAAIATQLSAMNPADGAVYATNLDAYSTALAELDAQYTSAVEAATSSVILVADRFPFLYLVNDYGLDYYAAFSGCSAETEASFETIVFLANKVDELGLDTILTIENPQHEIAQTVSATTQGQNQTILALDSMQSITATDVTNGATYLDTMTSNLAVLITALG